jgi:hypothetical protein
MCALDHMWRMCHDVTGDAHYVASADHGAVLFR